VIRAYAKLHNTGKEIWERFNHDDNLNCDNLDQFGFDYPEDEPLNHDCLMMLGQTLIQVSMLQRFSTYNK
jgi:hypothetical protein